LKDLVLGLIVLVAMVGFWFSNVQKRKAQKQMESMIKDVEILQDAEKNLTSLQNRYSTCSMFFDLQEYYHSSFIGYMMLHGIQY
jgi:ABC-type bacteriocin/lantibiotic exporter with double-glycine peptidase domain